MAMKNIYTRKTEAAPTDLNPNQPYIEQYDAMAEIGKQMADFGGQALDAFARADYEATKSETKKKFDEREIAKQDLKRNIELNQDPKIREDAYKKGMESIEKKYGGDIDSRFEEDYGNWVNLSDKKDLLDLRFNATKALQQQAVDTMFDNITQTAKQTVSANEAYAKMLDVSVKNDLDAALSRGAITQLQHTKALRNYNESKLYEGLNHRLLVDPEGLEADLAQNTYGLDQQNLDTYRVKTANALKNINLRENARVTAKQEADTLQAFDFINQRKEVPQNLLNRLPEKVQGALQVRNEYALQGMEVPTDTNVYDHLRTMFTQNPAHFKDINIYEYAGDLSSSDLAQFKQLQNAVVVNQKGKAIVSPEIKRASDLMKMAYEKAGISSEGNAEKRYYFNSAYTVEVEDFMAEKGRKPTRAEDEAIINRLTKQTVLQSGKWYSWANDKQAWLVPSEDYTETFVGYKEIDEKDHERIDTILKINDVNLSKFTQTEKQEWYEKFAGTLSLPRLVWEDAIKKRVKEINEYISKNKK